jgi:hypothetical protein
MNDLKFCEVFSENWIIREIDNAIFEVGLFFRTA